MIVFVDALRKLYGSDVKMSSKGI